MTPPVSVDAAEQLADQIERNPQHLTHHEPA